MSFVSKFFRDETTALTVAAASFGTFFYFFGQNAALMKRHKNFFCQKYRDGLPVPVLNVLKVKFEYALSDFGFTEWNSKFINSFITKSLDPIHLGCTKLKHGSLIGIPEYFQCATAEDIMETGIKIDGKPVDWSSEDGQRFLHSLFLSDRAQQFVIAKQVLMTDNYHCLLKSIIPTSVFVLMYATGTYMYSKLRLLYKPLYYSIIVQSIVVIFSSFAGLFMRDTIQLQYERSVDEEIFKSKEAYILGGIEYYEKLLTRNQALRKLMKRGETYYSPAGNEKNIFKSLGFPLTFKLKIAQEYLVKEYQKQEALTFPPPRKPHPIL